MSGRDADLNFFEFSDGTDVSRSSQQYLEGSGGGGVLRIQDGPAQNSDEIHSEAGAPSSPLDLALLATLDATDDAFIDVIIDLSGFSV